MPEKEYILIKGAREHNLKNIDVEIPRNKLVVITGLSGSGKSSLAFDTIYAEGHTHLSTSATRCTEQCR
jgi:excinuclease ABC subunit A